MTKNLEFALGAANDAEPDEPNEPAADLLAVIELLLAQGLATYDDGVLMLTESGEAAVARASERSPLH